MPGSAFGYLRSFRKSNSTVPTSHDRRIGLPQRILSYKVDSLLSAHFQPVRKVPHNRSLSLFSVLLTSGSC